MKFTEQNYPLLRFVKWPRNLREHPEFRRLMRKVSEGRLATFDKSLPLLDFQTAECGLRSTTPFEVRSHIIDRWPELQSAFMENIEVISANFLKALTASYDAFMTPEVFNEARGAHHGTVILPNREALCYAFSMDDTRTAPDGQLQYAVCGSAIWFDRDGRTLRMSVLDGEAYDADRAQLIDRNTEEAQGLFDFVLVHSLFKRYAAVTTVDAKSTGRRQESATQTGCPELKTTIDGIRFLDASWYTTIVRREGFGVKGHFRLQACGKGHRDRRLTYVNGYRKNGYVRRARLLTEQTDGQQ